MKKDNTISSEDAITLWCPMVRNVPLGSEETYHDAITSRDNVKERARGCIANDCMMWRWEDIKDKQNDYGYCGLAGKV